MKTVLILILGFILSYGLYATEKFFETKEQKSSGINYSNQDLKISSIEFKNLSNTYTNQFIASSQKVAGYKGGRIDLNALRELLKEVSDTQKYIYYRYGYNYENISNPPVPGSPNGVLYLLMSAGNLNAEPIPGNGKSIYKNGYQNGSFCPYTCD